MKPDKISPLTEASYYILISLIEPLHGYGVMKKVEEYSFGRLNLAPGTLYGALTTLQSHELITQFGEAGSRKKKQYKVTVKGIALIKTEIKRLREMADNGESAIKLFGGDEYAE